MTLSLLDKNGQPTNQHMVAAQLAQPMSNHQIVQQNAAILQAAMPDRDPKEVARLAIELFAWVVATDETGLFQQTVDKARIDLGLIDTRDEKKPPRESTQLN